jgi:hypothetical protein
VLLELDRFFVMIITYPPQFPGPTNLSGMHYQPITEKVRLACGIFFLAIAGERLLGFSDILYFFPERVSEKIENEVEEALIYNEPTVEESPFFYPASSPHEKEPSRRESTPWCGRSST